MQTQQRTSESLAFRYRQHLALCWLVAALGCSVSENRPSNASPPLAPRDLTADRQRAIEAQKTVDAEGRLLASDQMVAGVLLPRGMQREYAFEHEFYFRSEATLEQLQAYFGPRLLTGQVDRGGRGTVTFVNAQPKDSKEKAFVSVRIGPAPGNPKHSEVLIREVPMMPVSRPSETETRKQIETALKYAD